MGSVEGSDIAVDLGIVFLLETIDVRVFKLNLVEETDMLRQPGCLGIGTDVCVM